MAQQKIVLLYATRQASVQSTQSVPRLVAQVYQTFAQLGYQVLLITRSGEDEVAINNNSTINIPHVSKWTLRWHKYWPFAKQGVAVNEQIFFRKAIQLIRQKGFGDAMLITPHMSGAVALAAAFSPAQVFFWCHNYPKQAEVSRFVQALSQPIHLVVPSQALYRFIWQRLQENTLPFSLHIVPNYIATASVVPALPSQEQKLVLFHGGGTAPHKGLAMLLNVLKMLSPALQSQVQLRYVGQKLQQFTINGIAVTELPRMHADALMQEIARADVGVMSSLWFENAPVLLQEYLQGGALPLVSDSGGMPDLVAGYHATIVTHANELMAWKKEIETLAAVPAPTRWQWRLQNQQRFAAQYHNFNESVTAAWRTALLTGASHHLSA